MDHLHRRLAPISDAGWEAIDEEASQTIRHVLAGRKLVDFIGPLGWDAESVTTGRTELTQNKAASEAHADHVNRSR